MADVAILKTAEPVRMRRQIHVALDRINEQKLR